MRVKGVCWVGVILLMQQLSASAASQSSISISLPSKVEAGNIDPIVVPAEAVIHGQPIHIEEPFCVYSNDTENGDYQVTLSGSGQDGAFELTDGKHRFLYQVEYNDENTSQGYVFVKPTQVLSDQMAGSIPAYPCYVDNARVRLRIDSDDYERLPAGTYTGALYITVGEE